MTTDSRHHQWLWFDCETTHVDPRQGALLEWALVLAADDAMGDYNIVESYSSVVAFTAEQHAQWRADGLIDDFVEDMHTVNGLWAECASPEAASLEECDMFLAELAREQGGGQLLRLAGNSVHFDLEWCRVHLPRFAACLSHHIGNVSSLRDFATAWGVTLGGHAPESHRSLDDVKASLALAREARDKFVGGPSLVKRVAPDLLPAEYLIRVPDLARIEREGSAATETLPVIPGVVWR